MSYKDAKEELHGRQRKRVANNTWLERYFMDDGIHMYLHGNRIATFTKEYIRLSSARWWTKTTKNRLNLALDLAVVKGTVYQHKYVWYIYNLRRPRYHEQFFDGIKLNYDGEVIDG
jgi:hypothetical protein